MLPDSAFRATGPLHIFAEMHGFYFSREYLLTKIDALQSGADLPMVEWSSAYGQESCK